MEVDKQSRGGFKEEGENQWLQVLQLYHLNKFLSLNLNKYKKNY